MEAILSRLIDPMSAHRFLEEFWPGRAVVAHGPLARLSPLSDLSEWLDVESLLTLDTTRLACFYEGPDGKFRGLPTEPRVAHRLYEDLGATLCLSAIQGDPRLALVRESLQTLSAMLGVPALSASVHAYASPTGGGLPAHWDATEAFIVQVRGAKRWRYAPNHFVQWPMENYVQGGPLTSEVRRLLDDGKTPRMPDTEEVNSVVLEAGSVLYLPRGYWHETKAASESMSIALKFNTPTWADLVTTFLAAQLRTSPKWRQPAVGITGAGMVREMAAANLVAALKSQPNGPLDLSVHNPSSLLKLLVLAGDGANMAEKADERDA